MRDLLVPDDFITAISEMVVRGAPLIGITAAYGLYSAALQARPDDSLEDIRAVYSKLLTTRPTVTNLRWALDQQLNHMSGGGTKDEVMAGHEDGIISFGETFPQDYDVLNRA